MRATHKTLKLDREIAALQNELELEEASKHVSQFSKVVAGDIVIFNKALLYDYLEKRIEEQKLKIEDLFLLIRTPNGLEGEQLVDTKYGKLRVFFVNQPLKRSWLLHRKKFNYPKISKISTRGSHKTLDEIVKEHSPFTKDITTQANEALKSNFKVI